MRNLEIDDAARVNRVLPCPFQQLDHDEGDCEDDHDYDIKDDKDDVVRALQINGSSLPFERISITNQKRV